MAHRKIIILAISTVSAAYPLFTAENNEYNAVEIIPQNEPIAENARPKAQKILGIITINNYIDESNFLPNSISNNQTQHAFKRKKSPHYTRARVITPPPPIILELGKTPAKEERICACCVS